MALIFENIIKDLSQIGFFSKYKFRKRDASFLQGKRIKLFTF